MDLKYYCSIWGYWYNGGNQNIILSVNVGGIILLSIVKLGNIGKSVTWCAVDLREMRQTVRT